MPYVCTMKVHINFCEPNVQYFYAYSTITKSKDRALKKGEKELKKVCRIVISSLVLAK